MIIDSHAHIHMPPESFRFGEADLKPLRGGEVLPWRLQA